MGEGVMIRVYAVSLIKTSGRCKEVGLNPKGSALAKDSATFTSMSGAAVLSRS